MADDAAPDSESSGDEDTIDTEQLGPIRLDEAVPATGRLTRAAGPFGPFEILSELGRGAMGAVYLARYPDGRLVALKILTRRAGTARLRFEREARVLRDLDHPGIVRVLAAGRVEEQPFYAMEYVVGRPLSRLVAPGGIEPRRTADLVRQVAAALAYAHERGILHRDVKPSNVIVAGEPPAERARLVDFGLARDLAEPQLTSTGRMLGTPGYLPPEQIGEDWSRIDGRADVYSLGASFYALLTGRLPFPGTPWTEVVGKILSEDPPRPSSHRPDLPGRLDDLCRRMISRDRESRPATARAVEAELDRFLAERP